MELKSGEGTVVVADRDRCCNDGCNRNSGWGSGWGAVGGALVGGGFGAAAVSVWDKTNSDIRDSRDQMGAGFNRVMDRLCQIEHEQQQCCCETKGLIKEVKSELALQLERCCCDLKNGQQEIKCLI